MCWNLLCISLCVCSQLQVVHQEIKDEIISQKMEQREENVNYHQQRFRQHQQQQQLCHPIINNHAQLRKVLNVMFPPSYIKLNHRPPNTVCSLLNTTCWPRIYCNSNHDYYGDSREQLSDSDSGIEQDFASTEPASRKSVITLRDHLNSSLIQHQAKPVGLCPIRRAIYDQCFGRFRFQGCFKVQSVQLDK